CKWARGAGTTASAEGAAITLDTTADEGNDLTLSITDTTINNAEKGSVAFSTSGIDGEAARATGSFSDGTINNAEKGSVAFSTSGIDGDAASATVSFSDGTTTVTVDATAGTVDLSTLADGPVSSVLNVTDGAGNTASADGAAITLD